MEFFTSLRAPRSFNCGPHLARSIRLQGIRPAVGFIQLVAQGCKRRLMAGRCNVQRFAGAELKTRRAEVQFDIAFVAVAHPEAIVLIPVQPSKGQNLK